LLLLLYGLLGRCGPLLLLERFMVEKAAYNGPWQIPWKRAKKDPAAPKRPMSAFLYFSQDRRRELKKEYPSARNTEISSKLGKIWRSLTDEQRQPFVEIELRERKKYKAAIANWKIKDNARKVEEKEETAKKEAEMQHYNNMMRAQNLYHQHHHQGCASYYAPHYPPQKYAYYPATFPNSSNGVPPLPYPRHTHTTYLNTQAGGNTCTKSINSDYVRSFPHLLSYYNGNNVQYSHNQFPPAPAPSPPPPLPQHADRSKNISRVKLDLEHDVSQDLTLIDPIAHNEQLLEEPQKHQATIPQQHHDPIRRQHQDSVPQQHQDPTTRQHQDLIIQKHLDPITQQHQDPIQQQHATDIQQQSPSQNQQQHFCYVQQYSQLSDTNSIDENQYTYRPITMNAGYDNDYENFQFDSDSF